MPRYSLGIRHQVVTLFKGREAEGVVVSDLHSVRSRRDLGAISALFRHSPDTDLGASSLGRAISGIPQ